MTEIPAIAPVGSTASHDGDDSILIHGLEMLTRSIMHGRGVSRAAHVSYRKIISRAKALEAALDRREEEQGVSHD